MLLLTKVTCTQVLNLSKSERTNYFTFVTMLLICSLFTYQSATGGTYASGGWQLVQQAGYRVLLQRSEFDQAQSAYKNHDYVYSSRLFAILAEQGHSNAQYLLAIQYDRGLGIDTDKVASFTWYKKAAQAGIQGAQHNLAVAYAHGRGTDIDLDKAVSWWTRAAMNGNTDSQYNLGVIYASGRGSIQPDLRMALKWWRLAAINGDAVAQFNLGALYANGIGTSSRTCEASRWWKKSAKNGFVQAEMALALLETKEDYDVCR